MEGIQGNGEHVLIVEDDQTVRNMIIQMVRYLGYSVAAVASGEEAVRYLRQNQAHLVMLDMQMSPGINGRETFGEILVIRPGQRAILVSGYADSAEIDRAMELGISLFVAKPFTLHELGTAIKTALVGNEEGI